MKIIIEANKTQGAVFTLDDELSNSTQDEFIEFLEDVKMLLQLQIDAAHSVE